MNIKEDYRDLDYNRAWACIECGHLVVPYEDEPIDEERTCLSCKEDRFLE